MIPTENATQYCTMQNNTAHQPPAESPIFRSESTSFKRQPVSRRKLLRTIRRTISKYSRLWDLQRNLRQTDPAGTRRRGQRPAVNDLSEDMREKPDNLYEAIAARGEGAAGAIRKRRRPLCATIRMKKPSAKDLRRFSFRSTPCGIFGFSSRNQDLTSLRSFYLFCLPQGRYRKCESRYATNGPKRKKPLSSYLEAVLPFVPAPAALSQFRAETEI